MYSLEASAKTSKSVDVNRKINLTYKNYNSNRLLQ